MDELLNITEENLRKILTTVRTTGSIDLIYYEPIILCHRIERFMQLNGYASAAMLVEKMMHDKKFADFFLERLRVSTTEMFRDPQMWKELEQNVFDKFRSESVIKIWVPDICGDDELNSLLVLLEKNSLLKKSMVYATCFFNSGLQEAANYEAESKKMEVGIDNYKKAFADNSNLEDYFNKIDKSYIFSKKLLEQVIFIKHNIFTEAPPDMGFNLILFRNRALNYNLQTRKSCFERLYQSLLPGGFFVIGIGENLHGLDSSVRFMANSKTENIFKKL